MILMTADRISREFDDQVVLDQVSFSVGEGDRIGLVGKNGCGKTTLFDIMASLQAPDSGTIAKAKNRRIGYVQQDYTPYLELSLFEYVSAAREDLLAMHREISELVHELELNPEDSERLERLGALQNKYELEGGFNFENEVKVILNGLGFPNSRHHDRLMNFSGGEKNRAGLARALAGKSDLLLLDEPTNHLDIESTVWLEGYLRECEGAFIVVSHDRAFLAATVEKVWELAAGRIEFYTGGLDRYLAERDERRRLQAHRYRHQQQEIQRIEDFVRRNMAGQKTKQAQSKLKYLNRIKRIELPRVDGSGPRIRMNSSGRSYAHVLSVHDVTIGYATDAVAADIDFDLYRTDKVGLIGRNGSGKTTLLKSLVGELAPLTGDIRLGNAVDVAYFDQELSELDPQMTVLDTVWEVDPTAEMGAIRSFLARFGFSGDDVLKVVAALSGGEKTKLALAKLLYHPANFIIMDEPTNHLDMDSRESLEEALINYSGTCLIVSHDRYFLDRVVNRVMHLDGRTVTVYDGNYSYFREKTSDEVVKEEPKVTSSTSKASYEAFKEQSRRRSRHQKRLAATREEIANAEAELRELEKDIATRIPRHDWQRLDEASRHKRDLEDHLLELYATLEELQETDVD